MKNVPKEEQKQRLIDMMKGDEELGLYQEPKQETNLKKHLNSCQESQWPRRSAVVDKQE